MEGKVITLAKLNESENAKLVKENFEMKKEIENLQKKIKDIEEDDFYLSFDETKGPSHVATVASPEASQGSTLSSLGLSQGSTVSFQSRLKFLNLDNQRHMKNTTRR